MKSQTRGAQLISSKFVTFVLAREERRCWCPAAAAPPPPPAPVEVMQRRRRGRAALWGRVSPYSSSYLLHMVLSEYKCDQSGAVGWAPECQ